MKKIITYCSILLSLQGFSQSNCFHNVSTDTINPYNNSLPVGIDSNKYLNGFNWFPVTAGGLYADYPCTNISFGGVQYPEMNNILLNSLDDYNYIADGPLPLTKNGWELLLVNLGRYPDNVTAITDGNSLYAVPYIVIYNRYSGTIRIFINFGIDHAVGQGADAMGIQLKFVSEQLLSGLLRLNEGSDQPLDQPTDVNSMYSVCKAPALGQQWASTDIKVAYDPCSCYYPSKLKINLTQISSSSLTLHGRAITLDDQPLVNNTTLQVNPSEYLSGFDYTGGSVNSKGIAMHKSIVVMLQDFEKKYAEYNKKLIDIGEHNAKVKENLAIIRMARFVAGFIAAPPLGIIPNAELLAEKAAEIAQAERQNMSTDAIEEAYGQLMLNDIDKDWFKLVFKNTQKSIGAINAAGAKIINTDQLFRVATQIYGEKATTFISNNFVEQVPPVPPTMPTASFSEMHYEGSLGASLEVGGPSFYTPGTYGTPGTGTPTITKVYEYPVYNQILGDFALLKTPKVILAKQIVGPIEDIVSQNFITYTNGNRDFDYHKYAAWTTKYQLKLAEDLQYAINPALDVKNVDIRASFDIVATPSIINPIPEHAVLNLYNDNSQSTNANSNNINLDGFIPLKSKGEAYHLHYNNPDFNKSHFGYYGNPLPENTVDQAIIRIQTPYVPVDAFYPLISSVGIRNEYENLVTNFLTSTEVDQISIYNSTTNTWTVDLNNPLIKKPASIYPIFSKGYEYTFEIILKLTVDIEFNTVNQYGQTNKVTHLLTYPIPDANIWRGEGAITDLNFNVLTSPNINQIPENLTISDQAFNGQPITGCTLVGNNYTCKAWNKIMINGDMTTSNGYNVAVKAGRSIEELPESSVSPEIILSIEQILDFSHPMPQSNSTYIQSFCQGINGNAPSYNANRPVKSTTNIPVSEESDTNNSRANPFTFMLYPNPTTSETTIQLKNANFGDAVVRVYDITGKEVFITISAPQEDVRLLNVSTLERGVYFVKVDTYGETLTKQLIVQ